jgi:hypothetical protein
MAEHPRIAMMDLKTFLRGWDMEAEWGLTLRNQGSYNELKWLTQTQWGSFAPSVWPAGFV